MFEGDTLERYGTRELVARIKHSRENTLEYAPQKMINDLESEADILASHPKRGYNALKTRKLTEEYIDRR